MTTDDFIHEVTEAAVARYPSRADDKPLTDAHSIASAAVAAGLNVQARMAFVNGARWARDAALPAAQPESNDQMRVWDDGYGAVVAVFHEGSQTWTTTGDDEARTWDEIVARFPDAASWRLLAAQPATADREKLARIISEAQNCTDEDGEWSLPEDIADAILASGVIVPANNVRADAWDEGHSQALANMVWPKGFKSNPYRAAELRGES